MSLDDEDTPTTGLDLMLGDTHGDSRSGELSMLHGRTAGLGLLRGKRNKLKAEMYEEKEEEENIKVRRAAPAIIITFTPLYLWSYLFISLSLSLLIVLI